MTEKDKLYADELRNKAYSDYERLDHAINELERQTCEKPLKVRMTLEEEIVFCEETAAEFDRIAEGYAQELSTPEYIEDVTKNSRICAEERRQVAKYLRELQRMRKVVQIFLDQLEQNELVAVSTGKWNESIDDVEIFNAGGFTEKKRIGWTCSECGSLSIMREKFCPSCGVKMEEEEE